jgi:exodeoxyribonuclease V alpha subunit
MSVSTFSGRVQTVHYSSGDFHIVKVRSDDGTIITAKGNFPLQTISIGTWVSFEGKWSKHDTYGKQVSVTKSPVDSGEWDDPKVLSVLSSNGVGPGVRASLRTVASIKNQSLYDLLNGGDLTESDLDEFTQEFVLSRWNSTRTLFEAAHFLANSGVPSKVAGSVWRILGDELESKITEDPWVLVRVPGITFTQADEVAVRLGVPLTNPGRIRGAVLSSVSSIYRDGHSFASPGQVVYKVNSMVPGGSCSNADIANAIKQLCEQKKLTLERKLGESSALYDPWVEDMEVFCAQEFVSRCSAESGIDREVAEEEVRKWSAGRSMSLTDTQVKAAVDSVVESVSILTGLPGTGKTTTLQAVVSVLKDLSVPYLLVAPTGIAAKRMANVTGSGASTVHRAFSAKGFSTEDRDHSYVGITSSSSSEDTSSTKDQVWEFGPENPHPADVIIVDESSMVDLHMLYRILMGTKKDCRIVMVGDPYQLPSVGAGDVLRSLVKSGRFCHTHLSDIFRQENTSDIIAAAHDIHVGKTPKISGSKDFKLIPCNSESEACDIIKAVSSRLFEAKRNFQVLSPRHMGDAGVTNLNEVLRVAINPPSFGSKECRVMGSVIREGDRIMVTKNDYNKGVYNGDVGKVSRIDRRAKEIELRIFSGGGVRDLLVRYPYTKGPIPVRLAYAQTVHKSQGQEYDTIVLPIMGSFGRQLQRNLIYTAVTRAKKKVILVGEESALTKAVLNDVQDSRNSLLAERIRRV